jgi:hypothetical protein
MQGRAEAEGEERVGASAASVVRRIFLYFIWSRNSIK